MSTETMSDIVVGAIVKAFGIKGELKFHPSQNFWYDVLESEQLYMRRDTADGRVTQPLKIAKLRPHGKGSFVFILDGVTDRNEAEALVGAEVIIDEADIDVEMPDELMPFQVLGCTVRNEDGEVLGEVTQVMYSAAHDVYEVDNGERSFMVPAVPDFVISYDAEKRELTIRPLPGLLDA